MISCQTELDLGQVILGESKTFEITVNNTYSSTITVGVGFGCGACTNGGFYPNNNIPAGGSRILNVKFTPTGKGEQVKSIRLTYLEPGNPVAQKSVIRFKANVI